MNLDGTWRVRAISGPRKFMVLLWLLGNIKKISGPAGHNIARGIKWGVFGISEDGDKKTFTYDGGRIVDRVQFTGKDRLFGGFYYEGKYVGNFEMKRIK